MKHTFVTQSRNMYFEALKSMWYLCKVPCKREKVGHFCAWEKFYAHTTSRCINLLTSARNEITGEIESEMTREYCATLARFTRGLLKNTRAFEDFLWRREARLRRTGAGAETKIASYCSPDLQKDAIFRAAPSQTVDPRSHPTLSIIDDWAYALSYAKGSS